MAMHTLSLLSLGAALEAYARENDLGISEAARRLLARALGLPEPLKGIPGRKPDPNRPACMPLIPIRTREKVIEIARQVPDLTYLKEFHVLDVHPATRAPTVVDLVGSLHTPYVRELEALIHPLHARARTFWREYQRELFLRHVVGTIASWEDWQVVGYRPEDSAKHFGTIAPQLLAELFDN